MSIFAGSPALANPSFNAPLFRTPAYLDQHRWGRYQEPAPKFPAHIDKLIEPKNEFFNFFTEKDDEHDIATVHDDEVTDVEEKHDFDSVNDVASETDDSSEFFDARETFDENPIAVPPTRDRALDTPPIPPRNNRRIQSNDYFNEPDFWADDPDIKVDYKKHVNPREKCLKDAATLPRRMRVMFCEPDRKQLSEETKALFLHLMPHQIRQKWNIKIDQKPTVNRKALLIGMQYFGGKAAKEIQGTITDVKTMKHFLTTDLKFSDDSESVRLMTDEKSNVGTSLYPSRENIIKALHWLVDDAQPGDSLFFHYSGHAWFIPVKDGELEKDANEEYIYPADMNTAGPIFDNELHDILVDGLPDDVQLIAVFDSCSSCTILDLPFVYGPSGKVDAQYTLPNSSPTEPKRSWLSRIFRNQKPKAASPKLYVFSAASETEIDYPINTQHGVMGSLTRSFIKTLRRDPNQSYLSILRSIREKMYTIGYDGLQHQCLSTNLADRNAIHDKFDL